MGKPRQGLNMKESKPTDYLGISDKEEKQDYVKVLSGAIDPDQSIFSSTISATIRNPDLDDKKDGKNKKSSLLDHLLSQIEDQLAVLDDRISNLLTQMEAVETELNQLNEFVDDAEKLLKSYDDGNGTLDREAAITLLEKQGMQIDENLTDVALSKLLGEEIIAAKENVIDKSDRYEILQKELEDTQDQRNRIKDIEARYQKGVIDLAEAKQELEVFDFALLNESGITEEVSKDQKNNQLDTVSTKNALDALGMNF